MAGAVMQLGDVAGIVAAGKPKVIMPGMEVDLGKIVYVSLEGKPNRVRVGQVEVGNVSYIWVAHAPYVIAFAEMPVGYRQRELNGINVLVPEATPGQTLTLEGVINVPEARGPFGSTNVRTEVEWALRKDPYFVAVGSQNGVLQYRNVPSLEIRFL